MNDNFTFICGDCLNDANYPEEQADLILFDPPFWPYNEQYKQVRIRNKVNLKPILTPDKDHYHDWWDAVCKIAKDHLKKMGWYCYKSDGWNAKMTFPITQEYFRYASEVIWDRGRIGIGRKIRARHEEIECYCYAEEILHDQVECYTYGKPSYWGQEMLRSRNREQINLDGEIGKYKIKKWHGSSMKKAFPSLIKVSNFNNGTIGKREKNTDTHINQTPHSVWYNFLKFMCPPDGLILDLTAGSFSIAKAARLLNNQTKYNFRYHGIEIDPEYVDTAAKLFFDRPLGV